MAARTSQGKSAISSQIAMDVAEQGFKVMSFQLEMNIQEVIRRMVSCRMGIDSMDILKGGYNNTPEIKSQWEEFKAMASNQIFYLSENFGKTWPEIIDKVNEIKSDVDVVIIDHLHNIKSDPRNQRENINEYVRQFRALCVEKNIAGILCAQLNRMAMDKDNDMPNIVNLKDSGYVEEAADVVMILWWPWKSGRKWPSDGITIDSKKYAPTEDQWKNFFVLDIAKNRNGACHKIALLFEPQFYRFSDWQDRSNVVVEKRVSQQPIDWTQND